MLLAVLLEVEVTEVAPAIDLYTSTNPACKVPVERCYLSLEP